MRRFTLSLASTNHHQLHWYHLKSHQYQYFRTSIFSVIPSFSESLALPVDEIEEIQIDLSPYQIFSFFENSWLICSQPPQTKITIITFETVCDESAIMINHDHDSQLISNLKIQIEVYESFQGDLASVQFRLTPLLASSNTSILHSLTLDIAIESLNR